MTLVHLVAFGHADEESVNSLPCGLLDSFRRKLFRRAKQDQVPVVTFGQEPVKPRDLAPPGLGRKLESRHDAESSTLSSHVGNYTIFFAKMVRKHCQDNALKFGIMCA